MKRVTRAQLRGKALDDDCRKAYRVTHEYGPEDKRVYCFGLCAAERDFEALPKCTGCGAYVENAKPIDA